MFEAKVKIAEVRDSLCMYVYYCISFVLFLRSGKNCAKEFSILSRIL